MYRCRLPDETAGISTAVTNSPSAQHGFAAWVGIGKDEEFVDRNGARRFPAGDVNDRAQRRQRHRGVGRIHGVTRPAAEDRVVRVLTFARRAIRPVRLEARDARPEIPAPGALAQVAADGAHVAECRAADRVTRHGKGRELFGDAWIRGDRRDAHGSAEFQRAIRRPGDRVASGQASQVDELCSA